MSPLHILSAIAIILVVVGMAYPNPYAVGCAVILLAVGNFLK